jgi:hypothetical protein
MSRRTRKNPKEKTPVAGRSEIEPARSNRTEPAAFISAKSPANYHKWLLAGVIVLQIAWIAYLVVLAIKN